jgi:integrase
VQAKLTSTLVKSLVLEQAAYEVVDLEIKGFLLRVQPTGRKTFYFSYRNQAGTRKRIKIGVLGSSLTLAQARDQAIIYAGKVSAGEDIQNSKTQGRQKAKEQLNSTLLIFMEEQYKPWALANLKSGLDTIASVRRSFPDYLSVSMSSITVKQIEKWRTDKLTSGMKPSTVNRVINGLRGVLTKAVEWENIDTHPLSKIKSLKLDEGKKARYLSSAEEYRLYEALRERDHEIKAARGRGNDFRDVRGYEKLPDISHFTYGDRLTPLVILSLKTGMRRGELFDLEWEDVDFKNKLITVKGEIAKSSKTRHIPMTPIALDTIQAWRNQCPANADRVFPSDTGERLDNVKRSWTNLLKSANIQNFRWHDMRHDFASSLVMKGVPLNTVRELCGHADLNTTLRYAHLAPDHKAEAIALIG